MSCGRPRITISIVAPGHDLDQEFLSYELPGDLSIGDLKGFISAETDLPASSQQFYLNSVPINGDKQSLDEAGIKDGDMLAMLMRSAEQPNNMGGQRLQQPQGQQRRASNADADEIETARLSIMGNPRAMAQVREQRPALAQAVSDPIRFREVWMEMTRDDENRERERQEQMRLLNEDPFNVEAQKKIEEIIRQQGVQENLQFAYEYNPEGTLAFSSELPFASQHPTNMAGT